MDKSGTHAWVDIDSDQGIPKSTQIKTQLIGMSCGQVAVVWAGWIKIAWEEREREHGTMILQLSKLWPDSTSESRFPMMIQWFQSHSPRKFKFLCFELWL
jgi:hypothetical protein